MFHHIPNGLCPLDSQCQFCPVLLQECKSWWDTNRLHCQRFAWKGVLNLYIVLLSHVSCENLWRKIIIIILNWGWITWASFACRALRKCSVSKPPLPSTPLKNQMLEMGKILWLCKRFFLNWNISDNMLIHLEQERLASLLTIERKKALHSWWCLTALLFRN